MPNIQPNLHRLIQEIRTGRRELNAATARELMHRVSADGRVEESAELALLKGLDQVAPMGSVYGRELIKAFVEGSQLRLRSARFANGVNPFSPNSEANPMTRWWNTWARMNPFLEAWRVPPPSYARTDAEGPGNYSRSLTEQTEINARRALVGEEALQELVQRFEGAWRDVGTTQTRVSVNNDVYQVYRDQVQKQPIDEYNPLGAVESYLESHYRRK
ncbi:MAG: hypothetical protein H6728_00205 [Myxococcales bacterium]|nr:hypothetical protein [Myxococcales bacterium]MCB9641484.1 hypothetical protein [Myxococcales bacterium]